MGKDFELDDDWDDEVCSLKFKIRRIIWLII